MAETIPHFRPAQWTVQALKKVKKEGFPVRLSGNLFFDAKHGSDCLDGFDMERASLEGWVPSNSEVAR